MHCRQGGNDTLARLRICDTAMPRSHAAMAVSTCFHFLKNTQNTCEHLKVDGEQRRAVMHCPLRDLKSLDVLVRGGLNSEFVDYLE
jgi:hypothetical protein